MVNKRKSRKRLRNRIKNRKNSRRRRTILKKLKKDIQCHRSLPKYRHRSFGIYS